MSRRKQANPAKLGEPGAVNKPQVLFCYLTWRCVNSPLGTHGDDRKVQPVYSLKVI